MKVPIFSAGVRGIVQDIAAHELVPEAFTHGRNVRFIDGHFVRMPGEVSVYETVQTVPYFLLPVNTPSEYFWTYWGLDEVFCVDEENTHVEITNAGGPYSGGVNDIWNGCILGGIPVATNGVDPPQMWLVPAAANELEDLDNWPADTTCRIIRSFKNFLIAMDITEDTTQYANMVRWGHPADPGAVPSSWDHTLATNRAGRAVIDDVGGRIKDGRRLGETFIVYQDNSTYGIRFTGGVLVFQNKPILSESGILAMNCMTPFDLGQYHFVVTQDDIIVFNGQDARSVADKRTRRKIFGDFDSDLKHRFWCCQNRPFTEVWFGYVQKGRQYPSMAAIWNYRDDTWTYRQLNNITHAAAGIVIPDGLVWDDATIVWDEFEGVWGDVALSASSRDILMAQFGETGSEEGEDAVSNGTFTTTDDWEGGDSWEISGGTANLIPEEQFEPGEYADLSQSLTGLTIGVEYTLTYTVLNYVRGAVTPRFDDIAGDEQTADGTYTESYTPSSDNATLSFNVTDVEEVSAGGEEIVNGGFSTDSDWDKGGTPTWTISGGRARCLGDGNEDLKQASAAASAGVTYEVTFTVLSREGGTITPYVGGTAGTTRSSNGTFTEEITSGDTTGFLLRVSGAPGDTILHVDDVSVIAPAISQAEFSIDNVSFVGPATLQSTSLLHADQSYKFDGVDYESLLGRNDLALVGRDRAGNPKVDIGVEKMVSEAWIRAKGEPVEVRVGFREVMEAPIEWDVWQAFTPGMHMEKLDIENVNGKLICIEFRSRSGGEWEVDGYDLVINPTAGYANV